MTPNEVAAIFSGIVGKTVQVVEAPLDAVVPITYSEHLGQMHTALRRYKDGYAQNQQYATPRLAAILWLFTERHERCDPVECLLDARPLVQLRGPQFLDERRDL